MVEGAFEGPHVPVGSVMKQAAVASALATPATERNSMTASVIPRVSVLLLMIQLLLLWLSPRFVVMDSAGGVFVPLRLGRARRALSE